MDMILINKNKLKIILTQEDMSSYGLSCDTIDYENTETRRAFWDIFDIAKHQTGFDAASDRVYVQVYPSRCGGCEMFVTKLIHKKEERVPSVSVRIRDSYTRPDASLCLVYGFDTMNLLLTACEKLKLSGYDSISGAYADCDQKRYYLVLPADGNAGGYAIPEEYGKRMNGTSVLPYIGEHCTCLSVDSAVDLLAPLA